LTAEPLHPLRPETKGQAGACPNRTRAIPCTVRAVTGCQLPGATADDVPAACPIGRGTPGNHGHSGYTDTAIDVG
jgi:hypothetical protein